MPDEPNWEDWLTEVEDKAAFVADCTDPQAGLDTLDELHSLLKQAGDELIYERSARRQREIAEKERAARAEQEGRP